MGKQLKTADILGELAKEEPKKPRECLQPCARCKAANGHR